MSTVFRRRLFGYSPVAVARLFGRLLSEQTEQMTHLQESLSVAQRETAELAEEAVAAAGRLSAAAAATGALTRQALERLLEPTAVLRHVRQKQMLAEQPIQTEIGKLTSRLKQAEELQARLEAETEGLAGRYRELALSLQQDLTASDPWHESEPGAASPAPLKEPFAT